MSSQLTERYLTHSYSNALINTVYILKILEFFSLLTLHQSMQPLGGSAVKATVSWGLERTSQIKLPKANEINSKKSMCLFHLPFLKLYGQYATSSQPLGRDVLLKA